MSEPEARTWWEYVSEDDVKNWFDTTVRGEFLKLYHHYVKSGVVNENEVVSGYSYARCILAETAKSLHPFSDEGKEMAKRISKA